MSISEADVRHVALLARLQLTDEQVRVLQVELSSILDHVDSIRQLDLHDVPPSTHAIPLVNVMRPDEVRPGLSREAALANAPQAEQGAFVIPRIVAVEEA